MSRFTKYNDITKVIIGSAIEVHRHLGPGLLESTYKRCLLYELKTNNLNVQTELQLPIVYKEVELDYGYRIDILVEQNIVLELKVVDSLAHVHYSQILTYMKLGNHKLGFLLNFNVSLMKEGIKRFIL